MEIFHIQVLLHFKYHILYQIIFEKSILITNGFDILIFLIYFNNRRRKLHGVIFNFCIPSPPSPTHNNFFYFIYSENTFFPLYVSVHLCHSLSSISSRLSNFSPLCILYQLVQLTHLFETSLSLPLKIAHR